VTLSLLAGSTAASRQSLLFSALERAVEPESRVLDALILVPDSRARACAEAALTERFGARCWLPSVETFASLCGRHRHRVLRGRTVLTELERVAYVQGLLASEPWLGRTRPTRSLARRVVNALDAFAALRRDRSADIEPELVAFALGRARVRAGVERFADRYARALARSGRIDGTDAAWELVSWWHEHGYGEPGSLLTLDGFSELTPLMRAAFGALVGSFREVAVTLAAPTDGPDAIESEPGYMALSPLLSYLRAFPHRMVTAPDESASGPRRAAASLFHVSPAPVDANQGGEPSITIARRLNRRSEARTVARWIRSQVAAAASEPDPGEFVVAVPAIADYRELLIEAFEEYGILLSLPSRTPLREFAFVRRVQRALAHVAGPARGWNVREIEGLLGGAARLPEPPDMRERVARLCGWEPSDPRRDALPRLIAVARRYGFDEPFSEGEWYARLEAWIDLDAASRAEGPMPSERDRELNRRQELEDLAYAVCQIGDFIQRGISVASAGSPDAFLARFVGWLADYHLGPADWSHAADADPEEHDAWSRVDRVCRQTLEGFAASAGTEPVPASLWAEGLIQAIGEEPSVEWTAHHAGVPVIHVAQAGRQRSRHLFVLGLAETAELDACMEPPVTASSDGSERFHFREAIANADRVCLLYPERDGEHHLAGHPFIEDVRSVLGVETGAPVGVVPSEGENAPPLCVREALAHMGADDDASGAEDLCLPWENVAAMLDMERSRLDMSRWGPYDGYLEATPTVRQLLREHSRRPYSVSRIESYVNCPMRTFFDRVLRLRAPEERGDGVDALTLGAAIHAVLSEFYRGVPLDFRDDGFRVAARNRMREIAGRVFQRYDGAYPGVYWEEAKRELLRGLQDESEGAGRLARFIEFEASNERLLRTDQTVRARHIELGFGASRDDAGSAPPLRVPREGDEPILVIGRIDRVDVDPATGAFAVYDYKTGAPPSSAELLKGWSFQLPVYLLALEGYRDCVKPIGAALYEVSRTQCRTIDLPVATRRDGTWLNGLRAEIEDRVCEIDDHVRNGRFHLTTRSEVEAGCRHCPFQDICRIGSTPRIAYTTQPHFVPVPLNAGSRNTDA